ncbi:MAG: Photosystem I assembly protein Ycf3 [Candidatus Heimdallarchaeota archaeon LC_3]|nr:MAG: Photosystem I assembly protein Ycf3 [Candidatus Heimdallarchaeota archaeon LC_3]
MKSSMKKIETIRNLIEAGHYDEAENTIQGFESDLKRVSSLYLEAMLNNQKSFLCFRRGLLDEAIHGFINSIMLFKRAEEAKEEFDENKKLVNVSFSFNGLGLAYYRKGQANSAFNYLRKALEIRFNLGDESLIASTLNNVANLLVEAGASNSALDYLAEALDVLKGVKGEKKASITAMVYANIGNIHTDEGNMKEAAEYYQKAWDEIQKEKNWEPWTASRILFNLGKNYINNGDLNEAKDKIDTAIELQEKLSETSKLAAVALSRSLLSLTRIHLRRNENNIALITAERSITILHEHKDPTLGEAYLLVGWLHWKQNELETALENFKDAIKILDKVDDTEVNDIEAYSLLSGLYTDLKLFDEAEKALKHAQTLLTDPEADERVLILLYAGYLAQRKGELERAEKFFHQAELESGEEDAFNIELRSVLYIAQNHLLQYYLSKKPESFLQVESSLRSLEQIDLWKFYPTENLYYRLLQATVTLIRAEFQEALEEIDKIIEKAIEMNLGQVKESASILRNEVEDIETEMQTHSYSDFLPDKLNILQRQMNQFDKVLEPIPRITPI